MDEKPTYNDLERKIKIFEKEALEYVHKEREFNRERKLADYGHLKRTISLMGAIAESIARIVEREWAETEIRKCRDKIEALIKQTA